MSKRTLRNKGWIYFVQAGAGGPIKIGWTVDPQKRLEQLQTGSHIRLFILGAIEGSTAGESTLHKRWSEYRIRGEWFEAAPEIIDFVMANRHQGFVEKGIDDLDEGYWDWLHERLEIGFGPKWAEAQQ